MADYISREAAIEQTCFNCSEQTICGGSCDDIERIKNIPAADVRPVVYARWTDVYECSDGIMSQTCSACKERHDTTWRCSMPRLCPNCGADMRPRKGGKIT